MDFDRLETIRVSLDGPVATVRFFRPDRLNAWTPRMGVELFGALHELDRSGEVRAIVVTGEGRAFCAGADLASGGDTFADAGKYDEARAIEERTRPWNFGTPVIAAINGPAVGVGATVILHFDLRIASDRARIGYVFVRRGMVPELNSSWLLPRIVGMARASELMLTGRLLDAEEALAFGLVSRVVPHDDLLTTARALATEIATRTAPVSVAATKRLLWKGLFEPDPARAKALEDRVFDWAGTQPDAAEGIRSFLEKRDPAWTMNAARDFPHALFDDDER